ncbi:hypothetical protein J6590_007976 [Homalodisca vitripennis]|nr:hypothetical protein J6590_007976 [Homalodisca vitripennis]
MGDCGPEIIIGAIRSSCGQLLEEEAPTTADRVGLLGLSAHSYCNQHSAVGKQTQTKDYIYLYYGQFWRSADVIPRLPQSASTLTFTNVSIK